MIIISNIAGNTSRFTGRAASYDRYRQRYPAKELLELLQQWCELRSEWLVADIGAGTGILTEVFLQNGNPVLAIEPNEEMRTPLAALTGKWPLLKPINGRAEATTLANHSVDMITAGRAFHWFDTQPALVEFGRILKPCGWLVLASVGRANNGTPQSLAFERILSRYGTDYTYVRAGYRVHETLETVFVSSTHHAELHADQVLNWEAFLGQSMSLSMTPRKDNPGFPDFENALRAHFDTYSLNGALTIQTTCWLNAGRL